MVIKTDLCAFSGYKVYPGHGNRYIPVVAAQSTRPVFAFISKRAQVFFQRGKNPRDLAWTTLYRRNHKKGIIEEYKKSKKKKSSKSEKSIVGATLEFINAQKGQTAEQRAQILAAAKKAEAEKRKKLREKKEAATKKKDDKKKVESKPKVSAPKTQSVVPKTQKQHKSAK